MKAYAYLVLLILAGSVVPHPAAAHFLNSDKDITSVLHIEPHDVPVVGQPATFEWQLQDSSKRFRLDQCDCTLHIHKNDQEIFFQKLSRQQLKNSITTPGIEYTFMEAGKYEAALVGQPVTGGSFQQFVVVDDVLVVNNNTAGKVSAFWYSTYHFLAHYAYVGVFLIMFSYLFARGELTFQQKKKKVQAKTE